MRQIEDIQQEIIEEFQDYDDWMDRYQLLIDLGQEQAPLDERYKTESNLIDGCQSRVWLQADLTPAGTIHFPIRGKRQPLLHIPLIGIAGVVGETLLQLQILVVAA